MATARLIPSTVYNGSSSYLTISNSDRMCTNTDSTTYGTVTNTRSSTSSYYVYLRGFNFDSIPSDATVNSFTIKLKGYHSGGNTGTFALYNGTSAVSGGGSAPAFGTSANVTTFTNVTMTWSTLKSYGANLGIRVNCRRSNRNTQSVIYIYGAEILVDYTEAVQVDVTGVSLDKSTESVEEGATTTLTATVSPSNASNKNVTWSSSNTSIATVSGGVVTGVSTGSAVITVTTADGGFTDTCTITVTAPVYTQYKITNTLEPGKSYLIGSGNSGSIYLLSNEANGSRTLKGVAVTVTNDIVSITGSTALKTLFDCVLTTSGNSITTALTKNGQYLYSDSSDGLRMNTVTTLNRFWHYVGTKFWLFKSSSTDGYTDTSSEYKYYITWSNGNATDAHITSPSIEDTDIPPIYLFEEYTSATDSFWFKNSSGSWVETTKVYKKVNGSWVEQSDLSTVYDNTKSYVKG